MPADWLQFLLPAAGASSAALSQWPYGPNPILAGLAGFSGAQTSAREEEERRRREEEERQLRDQERQLRMLQIASEVNNPEVAAAMADIFPNARALQGLDVRLRGEQERNAAEEERRMAAIARAMSLTPEELLGRVGIEEGPPLPPATGGKLVAEFPEAVQTIIGRRTNLLEQEREAERKATEKAKALAEEEALQRRLIEFRTDEQIRAANAAAARAGGGGGAAPDEPTPAEKLKFITAFDSAVAARAKSTGPFDISGNPLPEAFAAAREQLQKDITGGAPDTNDDTNKKAIAAEIRSFVSTNIPPDQQRAALLKAQEMIAAGHQADEIRPALLNLFRAVDLGRIEGMAPIAQSPSTLRERLYSTAPNPANQRIWEATLDALLFPNASPLPTSPPAGRGGVSGRSF